MGAFSSGKQNKLPVFTFYITKQCWEGDCISLMHLWHALPQEPRPKDSWNQ